MRGCFGVLIYIFITFWVLLAVMLTASVVNWALDRQFYTDILADDALFDAFYSDAFPRSFSQDVFSRQYNAEDEASVALALALREVVPQDYLTEQIRGFVDAFFNFVEGENDTFAFDFDLRPVKANLLGEPGRLFATALADNLPECATLAPQSFGDTDLPACIPPGTTREQVATASIALLPSLTADLPDFIDVSDESEPRPADWPNFSADDVRSVFTGSALIGAGLLWLFNGFIGAGNSLRGLLSWLGISLFIPAGLVLLMGFGINSAGVEDTVRRDLALEASASANSEALNLALEDSIVSAVKRVGDSFVMVGGPATALAVLLFILSLLPFMKRDRKGDSHLNLPPSGRVGASGMSSNPESPISY